jgi:hypothetical protein
VLTEETFFNAEDGRNVQVSLGSRVRSGINLTLVALIEC